MTNLNYTGAFFLIFMIFSNTINGQIWYKLEMLEDEETYQVSLISDVDWSLPNNITSTGQITLKAPTLELEITDFQSLNPNLNWEYNSRYNAPSESTDFDYFSFGLESSNRNFEYEAGEEVPLISFKNANGCADFVSLLNNDTDPYLYSRSKEVNVGNQLTVVGARGNAILGVKGEKMIRCKKQVIQKEKFVKDHNLYPNPAHDNLTLEFNWKNNKSNNIVYIRDNSGKTVIAEKTIVEKGFNNFSFDISNLSGGIYNVEIVAESGESIPLDRFVKIYSANIEDMRKEVEDKEKSENKRY